MKLDSKTKNWVPKQIYDAAGHLVSALTGPPAASLETRTWDRAGRLQALSTVNLLSPASRSYVLDPVAYGYDAKGNQTSAGLSTFGFDAANRLASTATLGVTTDYAYDGDGLRTRAATTAWARHRPHQQPGRPRGHLHLRARRSPKATTGTLANPMGFAGQYHDPTGLQSPAGPLLRPSPGRFLSTDAVAPPPSPTPAWLPTLDCSSGGMAARVAG